MSLICLSNNAIFKVATEDYNPPHVQEHLSSCVRCSERVKAKNKEYEQSKQLVRKLGVKAAMKQATEKAVEELEGRGDE